MLYLEPLTPCLFESGCLLTQVCTETQCQRSHGGSRQAESTTKGNICCLGKGFKGGFSHHNVMLREVSFLGGGGCHCVLHGSSSFQHGKRSVQTEVPHPELWKNQRETKTKHICHPQCDKDMGNRDVPAHPKQSK